MYKLARLRKQENGPHSREYHKRTRGAAHHRDSRPRRPLIDIARSPRRRHRDRGHRDSRRPRLGRDRRGLHGRRRLSGPARSLLLLRLRLARLPVGVHPRAQSLVPGVVERRAPSRLACSACGRAAVRPGAPPKAQEREAHLACRRLLRLRPGVRVLGLVLGALFGRGSDASEPRLRGLVRAHAATHRRPAPLLLRRRVVHDLRFGQRRRIGHVLALCEAQT